MVLPLVPEMHKGEEKGFFVCFVLKNIYKKNNYYKYQQQSKKHGYVVMSYFLIYWLLVCKPATLNLSLSSTLTKLRQC